VVGGDEDRVGDCDDRLFVSLVRKSRWDGGSLRGG
jgi:hypothetical protein